MNQTNKKNAGKKRNFKQHNDMFDRPGLAARLCAQRLLGAVIEKNSSLDGLTDNNSGNAQYLALEPRDRSLVRAILGTSLRNRGTIEQTIRRLLDRPLPENAHSLKHLLHVATAQILYLSVPDHSAVDLAVTAADNDPRNRKYAGLVNAILRRIVRSKEKILAHAAKTDQAANNVPAWFNEMLIAAYGEEKAAKILQMQTYEPPIDLTVKGDPKHWAEVLNGTVLPNGSVRLGSFEGSLTDLQGFEDGEWWVQDMAASLPARLMGDLKGKKVADLCAAPGGKTAQLALAGADVTALDLSANRLKRLQGNFDRLKLPVKTHQTNLMDYEPEELFDAVLLDAPCSSTGTVRRHPDVPWTKTPDDLAKLATVQANLLARAVDFVKPGGIIVFSNCSLDPKEGEDVARAALKNPALEACPITPQDCEGIENLIIDEGFLRSTPADMPHENPQLAGMDGFFAARFRKKST